MERFEKTIIDRYESADLVRVLSFVDWYEIVSKEYFRVNKNDVSPEDFAELMIACVLDVAKRHPDAYKAALAKFPELQKPRWEERPDEEIKIGDWVKITGFDYPVDSAKVTVGKLYVVANVIDDPKSINFICDNGLPWTMYRNFVKVVQVD